MPVVTGNLDDILGVPLTEFNPRIRIELSEPVVKDAYLFPTKPIYVTPEVDGSFSVNLISTDSMKPAAYYSMSVEWLDADNNFTGNDFLKWKLYVPAAGGDIGSLLVLPWTPYLAWSGPEAPDGIPTARVLWLDTDSDTGELMMWS